MSSDPSSLNFVAPYDVGNPSSGILSQQSTGSGPLTEADLIGGQSTGGNTFGQAPTLPPVNVNSYDLSGSQVLDSLGGQNPFAGANLQPLSPSQLQPIDTSSGVSSLDSQLATELGLSGGVAPSSTPSQTSGLSQLFSGSNLLNDAALAGLGAYGLSQAKNAQSQTNSEIQPLMNESQSMLGESQNLLSQYNNGQLPSWAQSTFNQMNSEGTNLVNNYNAGTLPSSEQNYANELNNTASNLMNQYKSGTLPGYAQQYVDWTSQEATNLINAAPTKALETLAAQNFTDYTSGKLKPADQIQLDQTVQSQKQRVASLLAASGDADSSVLAAQYQQIDNQAQVTRQQVLNSYFQTGDQAYNSWLSSNVDASQIKAQGAQFANQVFAQMLQDAIQTQEFAANYTAQGLNTELQAGLQTQEYAGTYKEKTFTDMLNGAFQGATIGDQALTQAIGIQLQSDNQLSQMVGSLMQSIATAYSYSAYQRSNGGYGGGSGGGGSGGGGGGSGQLIGNIVGGIEQYGGAAVRGFEGLFHSAGGQAASATGAESSILGDTGKALGAVGAAYSLYNTVDNWQSGNTGSDALNAAETGASVGSFFGPVGFVVGGIIGGAVGAISSAFGGGKNDPETLNWDRIAPQINQNPSVVNSMTPSQVFQSLAGIMDAKNNSPGHSTNLELKFGRMGENAVMGSMTSWVNQAIKSGQISANTDPSTIYNKVVKPQLQQMGAYVNSNDIVTKNGTRAGGAVDALLTRLIGLWQDGNLNSSTPVGVNGQTVGNLPAYGA